MRRVTVLLSDVCNCNQIHPLRPEGDLPYLVQTNPSRYILRYGHSFIHSWIQYAFTHPLNYVLLYASSYASHGASRAPVQSVQHTKYSINQRRLFSTPSWVASSGHFGGRPNVEWLTNRTSGGGGWVQSTQKDHLLAKIHSIFIMS